MVELRGGTGPDWSLCFRLWSCRRSGRIRYRHVREQKNMTERKAPTHLRLNKNRFAVVHYGVTLVLREQMEALEADLPAKDRQVLEEVRRTAAEILSLLDDP